MISSDAEERKGAPVFTGVLRYFPLALVEVAKCSKAGNDQHNPGKPLHWDRTKSGDEGDALVRHQLEAGTVDTDGIRHSAKVAWRALAQLQKELEAEQKPEVTFCTWQEAVLIPEVDAKLRSIYGLTTWPSCDKCNFWGGCRCGPE